VEEEEEEVAPVRKVAAAKPVKKPTARRVVKAEVVEAQEVVAPVAAEVTESAIQMMNRTVTNQKAAMTTAPNIH